MQPHQVDRIEQMLGFWEDENSTPEAIHMSQRFDACHIVPKALTEAMKNASGLRQHVLNARREAFDADRFRVTFALSPGEYPDWLRHYPGSVHAWIKAGCRAFHIPTTDLVNGLIGMPQSDRLWRDVPWPYDAFAVTMDGNLRCSNGFCVDCILVSKLQEKTPYGNGVLRVWLIDKNLAKRQRVDRKGMYKAAKRGNAPKVVELAKKHLTKHQVFVSFFTLHEEDMSECVEQDVVTMFNKRMERSGSPYRDETPSWEWNAAARIATGLSLLLSRMPPDAFDDAWETRPADGVPETSITRQAQICNVNF